MIAKFYLNGWQRVNFKQTVVLFSFHKRKKLWNVDFCMKPYILGKFEKLIDREEEEEESFIISNFKNSKICIQSCSLMFQDSLKRKEI